MEKDKYTNNLSEQEKLTLEYLSKTVLSGVRPDELAILSQLLHKDYIGITEFNQCSTGKGSNSSITGTFCE